MREEVFRDSNVIVNDSGLGELFSRIEDFVEVGNGDSPVADVKMFRLRRHDVFYRFNNIECASRRIESRSRSPAGRTTPQPPCLSDSTVNPGATISLSLIDHNDLLHSGDQRRSATSSC